WCRCTCRGGRGCGYGFRCGSGCGCGSHARQREIAGRLMRAFSNLCATLECSSPVHQQAALADYLSRAAPKDAAWALYFLSGRRLKRVIRNTELAAWAAEAAGLPPWLFDEAHT